MLRHVIHKSCVPLLLPWAARLQDADPLFQQVGVWVYVCITYDC